MFCSCRKLWRKHAKIVLRVKRNVVSLCVTNGTASMKAVTKPNETGLFNIILTQMKQMIQIRCKNNKKSLNVPTGSTLSEIFLWRA